MFCTTLKKSIIGCEMFGGLDCPNHQCDCQKRKTSKWELVVCVQKDITRFPHISRTFHSQQKHPIHNGNIPLVSRVSHSHRKHLTYIEHISCLWTWALSGKFFVLKLWNCRLVEHQVTRPFRGYPTVLDQFHSHPRSTIVLKAILSHPQPRGARH